MPLEIVNKYRLVYKECFVAQSLLGCKEGKFPAWHGNCGFKDIYVPISYAGKIHPRALPSVTVDYEVSQPDVVHRPYIQLREDFKDRYNRQQRKVYLAHEWIHAMMILDGRADTLNSLNYTKNKVLLLHSLALGQKIGVAGEGFGSYSVSYYCNPWSDTEQLLADMHTALRRLLVSEDSVERFLIQNYSITLDALKEQVQDNNQDASELIRRFISEFSTSISVSWDLVASRLINEIL